AMTVVGNNIANVNTVGYKASSVAFSDIVGESAGVTRGGGRLQGVRVQNVGTSFTQGALQHTGVVTNLGIDGKGFFIVDGAEGQMYTRVGDFHFDAEGVLRTIEGDAVQGFLANPDGTIGAAMGDIKVETESVTPMPTSRIDMELQLDATATPAGPFDPANPSATSNYATSTTIYDSLGNEHVVSVYFVKTAANSWDWHAMVDGGDLVGGTAGTAQEVANGTLTFTTSGELDTETQTVTPMDFVGAAPGQAPTFDFGQSLTTDGATAARGTTQYASETVVHSVETDGYAAGELAAVRFEADGTIVGTYTNFEERTIGKIALANFANPDGLSYTGDGKFVETRASGQAIVGQPGDGRHGNVVSQFLEGSNVDMTGEFVNLINYQRSFQANARVISVADELLLELVNLRR
ncbi:MAG: flagellar hook protein FlgE, partial [Candidatus Dadabacteria bacterium]